VKKDAAAARPDRAVGVRKLTPEHSRTRWCSTGKLQDGARAEGESCCPVAEPIPHSGSRCKRARRTRLKAAPEVERSESGFALVSSGAPRRVRNGISHQLAKRARSEGLKSGPGRASLRIPFRPVLETVQEGRMRFQPEVFASNHLTDEPIRFILQGCQRIGNEIEIRATRRAVCKLFENRS